VHLYGRALKRERESQYPGSPTDDRRRYGFEGAAVVDYVCHSRVHSNHIGVMKMMLISVTLILKNYLQTNFSCECSLPLF
jgi:hypothetical protein